MRGLADELGRLSGVPAAGVWAGPGRVNLIGEHTDYNAGLALPFALDRRTEAAVAVRGDRRWRCWSRQQPGPVEVALDELGPDRPEGWARYVLGVAEAFGAAGVDVPGVDLLVDSTVPVGSGLSSSAALTAAVATALNDLTGAGLEPTDLVAICHRAEAGFVGAPTGTLDQRAVLLARAGHALLIDFATGETAPVPLSGVGPLVVVATGVRHNHATGGYRDRRRECEEAARALGAADLRHADAGMIEQKLTGVLAARARHVVTENARVQQMVAELRSGKNGAVIGNLLYASHCSLRDDFEVSCPELDQVVEATRRAGAAGARLIGGGFGGCVLVAGLPETEVRGAATGALGLTPPAVFEAVPSGPAHRLV